MKLWQLQNDVAGYRQELARARRWLSRFEGYAKSTGGEAGPFGWYFAAYQVEVNRLEIELEKAEKALDSYLAEKYGSNPR